jgi:hypothetical protein
MELNLIIVQLAFIHSKFKNWLKMMIAFQLTICVHVTWSIVYDMHHLKTLLAFHEFVVLSSNGLDGFQTLLLVILLGGLVQSSNLICCYYLVPCLEQYFNLHTNKVLVIC